MKAYGLYRTGGFEQDEFALKPYEKINIAGSFGGPVNYDQNK